ncbi:MAG: hypothetical protein J6A21_03170 [Lentisphaeria bacterium]|nr:hypothetical protein [Lentisphaeria bacterium]
MKGLALFSSLVFLLFSLPGSGEEEIRLFLADGKILRTSAVKAGKNGSLLFYHDKAKRFVLIPKHLLRKAEIPKGKELKKADDLFRKKEYGKSALLYKACLEKMRGLPPWEIYSALHAARAFLLAGEKEEALKILESVPAAKEAPFTEETPEELYEVLLLSAELYCGKGEKEKAYPLLEKLVSCPKDSCASQALLLKADTLFSEGKFRSSFDAYFLHTILFPASPRQERAKAGCKKALEKLQDPRAKLFAPPAKSASGAR